MWYIPMMNDKEHQELISNFERCYSDQVLIMEKKYLMEKPIDIRPPISTLNKAMILINNKLIMAGKEPLDMVWIVLKEGEC
jgi:hypothetical protein